MRAIGGEIRRLGSLEEAELAAAAKDLQAPLDLVREVAEKGRLPVVMFSAGGVATPADAALMMRLGAEGVFVGSGIFKSEDPQRTGAAVVEATTHFRGRSADRGRLARSGRAHDRDRHGRHRGRGRPAPKPRLVGHSRR